MQSQREVPGFTPSIWAKRAPSSSSFLTISVNCSGVVLRRTSAEDSSFAATSGSPSARLISLFKRDTILRGIPAGAKKPSHEVNIS